MFSGYIKKWYIQMSDIQRSYFNNYYINIMFFCFKNIYTSVAENNIRSKLFVLTEFSLQKVILARDTAVKSECLHYSKLLQYF